MRSPNFKNLWIGLALSMLGALVLFIMSFFLGKNNFFLLLNTNLGITADYFFRFFSDLGDGLLWIPLLGYFFYKEGKKSLPFLISCFAISTLLTQVCKILILPAELRPTSVISIELIHIVQGVTVHTAGSFPSGHTATAFVFYLIFCLVFKSKWWIILGLVYALVVGYSRVYLAQHFPLDVAGGIIVAVASVVISVYIDKAFYKSKTLV